MSEGVEQTTCGGCCISLDGPSKRAERSRSGVINQPYPHASQNKPDLPSSSSRYFQITVNSAACMPLVISRVCSPLKKSPCHPSRSSTCARASWYVIVVADVCLVVLSTRIPVMNERITSHHQRGPNYDPNHQTSSSGSAV